MSELSSLERLQKHFVFEESLLDAMTTDRAGEIKLKFRISYRNLSVDHPGIDQSSQFSSRYPSGELHVTARNISFFTIDRLAAYGSTFPGTLRSSELDDDPTAQEGPKTVIGLKIVETSQQLDRLGDLKKKFHHLILNTMDARVDVVFSVIEITP